MSCKSEWSPCLLMHPFEHQQKIEDAQNCRQNVRGYFCLITASINHPIKVIKSLYLEDTVAAMKAITTKMYLRLISSLLMSEQQCCILSSLLCR